MDINAFKLFGIVTGKLVEFQPGSTFICKYTQTGYELVKLDRKYFPNKKYNRKFQKPIF